MQWAWTEHRTVNYQLRELTRKHFQIKCLFNIYFVFMFKTAVFIATMMFNVIIHILFPESN